MMKHDGPPGATANGFNENLALFASGHCGMWIDATSAGGLSTTRSNRQVPTRSASPRRRPATSEGAPAGSGPGLWRFRRPRKQADAARSSSPGRPRRTTSSWSARAKGWVVGAARARAIDLRQPRLPEGGAVRGAVLKAIEVADPTHRPWTRCPTPARSSSPSPNSRPSAPRSARFAAALAGQQTGDQALDKGAERRSSAP